MEPIKGIRTLIFDADDTLWKNNFYFVEATEAFIAMWVAAGMEESAARQAFLEFEKKAVRERGYGSENFLYILQGLWERLSPRYPAPPQTMDQIIERFKEHRSNGPVLFEGVKETMTELARRYALYVLTKGRYDEQKGKIIRAGIDKLVRDYFIVPEKDITVYRELLASHNWSSEQVCMVGNSPKSDINPALACGMHAVYIPYEHTWHLDHDAVSDPHHPRMRTLKTFRELTGIL